MNGDLARGMSGAADGLCRTEQDAKRRGGRRRTLVALPFCALVVVLVSATSLDAGQPPPAAAQTQSQEDDVTVLSRCLVSIYEAIRFAVVNTQGKGPNDLRALSGRFQRLLADFDRRFAEVGEARGSAEETLVSEALPGLRKVGASLHGIGSALSHGDREGLPMSLMAGKFAVGELREHAAAAGRLIAGPAVGQGSAFNELTHVIVDEDRRGVEFFGSKNPAGPKQRIPYDQLLAAALRLPEESGDQGLVGSIPGFSLEPSPDFLDFVRETFRKDYVETLATSGSEGHRANLARVNANIESLKGQALGQVRQGLKLLLYTRMGRRATDERMDRIASVDDLSETLEELKREGILRKTDGPTLDYLIQAAILEFQTIPGAVLFFPGGTRPTTPTSVYVEPMFFGMESDTRLAQIVFESDIALKTLAGPAGQELKKKLPFHQTYLEWRLKNTSPTVWRNLEAEGFQDPVASFQIVPKSIGLAVSADGRIISFEHAELTVRAGVRDRTQRLPQVLVAYADFLSRHYGDYAREIVPLWELRELAKVVAAARYLKPRGLTLDLSLDRSWTAPDRVEAEWDAATFGTGSHEGHKDYVFSRSVMGGVDLQVEKSTEVRSLPGAAADRLAASAGRAAGQPIAVSADELVGMDDSDAKASLGRMEPERLESLETQVVAEQEALSQKIQRAKERETRLRIQVASPPDLRTWTDVAREMYENLPGVGFMEELGKKAAESLEEGTTRAAREPLDWQRAEAQYQRFTDEVLRTRDVLNEAARLGGGAGEGGPHNLVESSLIIVRESALAYRAVSESDDWRDAAVASAPHVGNVLEQLPEHVERYFPASSAKATITLGTGSKANLYLEIAKISLEFAYEAANIELINEGVRQEREANRLLLMNMVGNRQGLERSQQGNRRLLDLIAEEKRSRESR